MTRDEFQDMAWASFIEWALQDADMLAAYKQATGRIAFPPPPKTAFEAAIDRACGVTAEQNAEDFAIWVTAWHWGWDEAPVLMRERMERARAKGWPPMPTVEQVAESAREFQREMAPDA